MKCINCYREIKDNIKFCPACGAKQPADRQAYELEHPELADALPEDEIQKMLDQQQPPVITPETPADADAQPSMAVPPLIETPVVDVPAIDAPVMDTAPATQAVDNVMENENVAPGAEQQVAPELSQPEPQPSYNEPQESNLTSCPNCGNMMSVHAVQCPHCGFVPGQAAMVPVEQNQSGIVPASTSVVPGSNITPPADNDQQKNQIKMILLGLLAGLGVLALVTAAYFLFSDKATYLVLDPSEVSFTREGGAETISASTDARSFKVKEQPDWVDVSTDDNTITISCSALSGNGQRDGEIKVKAGGIIETIKVSQHSKATFIQLSEERLEVGKPGEHFHININSDGGTFNVSSPDYCTVSEINDKGFDVKVEANTGKHRNGTITVSDGDVTANLAVDQKGTCSKCGGRGRVTCSKCGGSGTAYYYDSYWDYWDYYNCSSCNGSGRRRCSTCGGNGIY